jgi:hypothetical protein
MKEEGEVTAMNCIAADIRGEKKRIKRFTACRSVAIDPLTSLHLFLALTHAAKDEATIIQTDLSLYLEFYFIFAIIVELLRGCVNCFLKAFVYVFLAVEAGGRGSQQMMVSIRECRLMMMILNDSFFLAVSMFLFSRDNLLQRVVSRGVCPQERKNLFFSAAWSFAVWLGYAGSYVIEFRASTPSEKNKHKSDNIYLSLFFLSGYLYHFSLLSPMMSSAFLPSRSPIHSSLVWPVTKKGTIHRKRCLP